MRNTRNWWKRTRRSRRNEGGSARKSKKIAKAGEKTEETKNFFERLRKLFSEEEGEEEETTRVIWGKLVNVVRDHQYYKGKGVFGVGKLFGKVDYTSNKFLHTLGKDVLEMKYSH